MRHFAFLDPDERERLFLCPPEAFAETGDTELLAVALGATLYCPADRPRLAADLIGQARAGVVSAVACLEDAIADGILPAAEHNLVAQLSELSRRGDRHPVLFVRVRAPEQIPMLLERLGEHARVLTGFVLPKFGDDPAGAYLDELAAGSTALGRPLLAMPVLESSGIVHAETRLERLLGVRGLLEKYREHVLAVRLGATDLSATFGLRRSRDLTVYDVRVVADVIADIVNVFARGGDYVVTGPVWEYFTGGERMFKPQLRESPFVSHDERRLRAQLIASDLDGLIREVALDRANGLTGKTVIHPTHVAPVHALSVVTHEEYLDATDILGTAGHGGVASSSYRNKMNESKPHAAWARRTMLRARAFGVAREDVSFVDLLAACLAR
jgi:citrate lyase beta subunit